MKSLFLLSIILGVFSFGYSNEGFLTQQVGSSCQTNSPFIITSFDVNPWSPWAGSYVEVAIVGTFTQNASVGQVQFVLVNGKTRNFQALNVNENYLAGNVVTFNYQLNIPNQNGQWTTTATVREQNTQNVYACWSFQFND